MSARPLAGIRVVELGQNLAGPVASQIFADLGAAVIKIEKPDGGDDARGWGPPFVDGASLSFHAVNRGKRSVTLDLRRPEAMAALRRLVDEADVFVHNLRPGAAEELGLGGPALLATNPRLVYCGVSAFGDVGPLRLKPGYEILIQAFAGLMSVTGTEDGPPVRMGTSVIDYGTGIWTALAALAALLRRERTGRGCVVGTSLLETGLFWLARQFAEYSVKREPPERHATGSHRLVSFQAFETANGPLVIAAGNDRLFQRLVRVIGLPGWADDPRFRTVPDRYANRDVLLPGLVDVLRRESKEHWMERLEAAGVPCAPILTVPEVLEQPQVRALEMFVPEGESGVELMSLPMSFDGERPRLPGRAPRLGEHTTAVLGG